MNDLKKTVDVVVVIPVGPACRYEFIVDTINSFIYYTTSSYAIIIADDSQQDTGDALAKWNPAIDVIKTTRRMGKLGGLYLTLSQAFQYTLTNFSFRVLLRLDTDALITGWDPVLDAINLFDADDTLAIAGQYPYTYDGPPWDVSWPAGQIYRLTRTRKFFRHPIVHHNLRQLVGRAKKFGYRHGESVFGGACFYSAAGIRALSKAKLLGDDCIGKIDLEEDHIFSLLVKSIGLQLGDLSTDRLPFACAWKGLPASPVELHERGKKVVHSTRYWAGWDEEQIRAWFRMKRVDSEQKKSAAYGQ